MKFYPMKHPESLIDWQFDFATNRKRKSPFEPSNGTVVDAFAKGRGQNGCCQMLLLGFRYRLARSVMPLFRQLTFRQQNTISKWNSGRANEISPTKRNIQKKWCRVMFSTQLDYLKRFRISDAFVADWPNGHSSAIRLISRKTSFCTKWDGSFAGNLKSIHMGISGR